MEEALRDPKQKLLANLSTLTGTVDWKLPGNRTARVAPQLLVKTYADHGSMVA